MELLNQGERQKLIDLLSDIPDIGYLHVRLSLLATLPPAIKNNVHTDISVNSDITSIVDIVSSGIYADWKLDDGQYPILVVIKNAIGRVKGSHRAKELFSQVDLLRGRLKLDPEETGVTESRLLEDGTFDPSQAFDQFMKALYNFIQQLPASKSELEDIYEAFGYYIKNPDCGTAFTSLTDACKPIREFLPLFIKEQSTNGVVKAPGLLLKSALSGFNTQMVEAEKCIKHFCDSYGSRIRENQPASAREVVQERLEALLQTHTLVLQRADELYKQLSGLLSARRVNSNS